MNDFSIADVIDKIKEIEEQKTIQDLKDKGIVTDACLICHPNHKLALEEALSLMKIKKIPIVWSQLIEKDKLYMVTDKELVEDFKKAIMFDVQ